jgi:arylsulfatase
MPPGNSERTTWGIVPAQVFVAKFLKIFEEFPPRQKAASFSIDQVMEKMKSNVGSQ